MLPLFVSVVLRRRVSPSRSDNEDASRRVRCGTATPRTRQSAPERNERSLLRFGRETPGPLAPREAFLVAAAPSQDRPVTSGSANPRLHDRSRASGVVDNRGADGPGASTRTARRRLNLRAVAELQPCCRRMGCGRSDRPRPGARRGSRGVAAEDRKRRELERDVHDGAQQRLVALRVKLALVAAQLEDQDRLAPRRSARSESKSTRRSRSDRSRSASIPHCSPRPGLGEAVWAAVRAAALPTTVHGDGLGRCGLELETTVCFFCSEALQNAAKRAREHRGLDPAPLLDLWARARRAER